MGWMLHHGPGIERLTGSPNDWSVPCGLDIGNPTLWPKAGLRLIGQSLPDCEGKGHLRVAIWQEVWSALSGQCQ
jgi:hypothetical protein